MNTIEVVLLAVLAAVIVRCLLGIAGILLVDATSSAVGGIVTSTIDGALAELRMHDQHSNHARFEGTWTPREMRLAKIGRLYDQTHAPVHRHAAVEGAEPPPSFVMPEPAYEWDL